METDITLLNFDGTYSKQAFYLKSTYTSIDFDFLRNISLFCEQDTLMDIADILLENHAKGIHYLGSGNYHYISYLLQSEIKQPYTLVLFDHHTDTIPAPSKSIISCGSWVLESLKNLPMLKKVCIIGVSEDAQLHIPKKIQNNIAIFPEHSLHPNLPTITKSILNQIPTDSIYISIDKDVLHSEDALTAWDHGTLRLQQMMWIVKSLYQTKSIVGVDVCGEYPVNPVNEFRKETKEALVKNDRANSFIFKSINHWSERKKKSSKRLHA